MKSPDQIGSRTFMGALVSDPHSQDLWRELHRRYHDCIVEWIRDKAGVASANDAEDAYQDLMIKLRRRLTDPSQTPLDRSDRGLRPYLKTAAKNIAIDAYRKRNKLEQQMWPTQDWDKVDQEAEEAAEELSSLIIESDAAACLKECMDAFRNALDAIKQEPQFHQSSLDCFLRMYGGQKETGKEIRDERGYTHRDTPRRTTERFTLRVIKHMNLPFATSAEKQSAQMIVKLIAMRYIDANRSPE